MRNFDNQHKTAPCMLYVNLYSGHASLTNW